VPRRLAVRLLLAIAGVLVLSSCQLDETVELVIGADGTGTLSVTAEADADVVQQAPGLATDLRFDDAIAAGWSVDGPTATEAGGLHVTLTHPVGSPAEATNLLNSLGPPFTAMGLERVVSEDGDTTTDTLSGQLTLTDGFGAFADSDLVTAVGGVPFADQLAAAGATPASSMTVTLRAQLPGDVDESSGRSESGWQVWDAPLDGTTSAVLLRTIQQPSGGGLSSLLAAVLLILLIAWVVAATAFIVSVVRARARKAARRRRALSRLR
jgi:hypothetical protein